MKKQTLGILILTIFAGLIAACRQHDIRTAIIEVPGMDDARAIRIVTNAALDEVAGRFDGIHNECQVDLTKGIVLYHESPRLADKSYQRQLEACLAEVGYNGEVLAAGWNPPPPVPTVNGPRQMWPDRITAVIKIPNMKTARDANIVMNAIAYARLGKDDPRIVVNSKSRTLTITYESLALSIKNIEFAIACAGYPANSIRANHDFPEGLANGWTPVKL